MSFTSIAQAYTPSLAWPDHEASVRWYSSIQLRQSGGASRLRALTTIPQSRYGMQTGLVRLVRSEAERRNFAERASPLWCALTSRAAQRRRLSSPRMTTHESHRSSWRRAGLFCSRAGHGPLLPHPYDFSQAIPSLSRSRWLRSGSLLVRCPDRGSAAGALPPFADHRDAVLGGRLALRELERDLYERGNVTLGPAELSAVARFRLRDPS